MQKHLLTLMFPLVLAMERKTRLKQNSPVVSWRGLRCTPRVQPPSSQVQHRNAQRASTGRRTDRRCDADVQQFPCGRVHEVECVRRLDVAVHNACLMQLSQKLCHAFHHGEHLSKASGRLGCPRSQCQASLQNQVRGECIPGAASHRSMLVVRCVQQRWQCCRQHWISVVLHLLPKVAVLQEEPAIAFAHGQLQNCNLG